MYKVMLVDDEDEVRVAIERRINWEEIGFSVVATAENGQDALELALEVQPDVVMTDIHMPFMNGLDFSRQLKEKLPATKIVIFSGYDDFEYAKEAITLEAEEYILKPIDSEDLKRVFIRIKDRLDDELSKRRNIENLEHYFKESFPFLREQFLIGLLEGHLDDESIEFFANNYNFSFNSNFYVVSIIKLSNDNLEKESDISSQQLLSISLSELVKESLDEKFKYNSINYLGNVVVIAQLEKEEEFSSFVNALNRICKISAKQIQKPTTAGVGKIAYSLEGLSLSYKEAADALAYRILYDDDQALCINDVEPKTASVELVSSSDINEIIKLIKIGSKDELVTNINELFSKIQSKSAALYQIELLFVEVYFEIMRLAKSIQLNEKQYECLELDIYAKIKSMESFDAMVQWLIEYALLVRGFIRKERQDTTTLLINKAKVYVEENYSKTDITVDEVCSYLGVSSTYFSSLFKKNTGKSFITYLTDFRMSKAIELLESTDEKSYVIAGMVGYEEPNYFSYVFKKCYGISPSKYRQSRESIDA